jgi:hypothetical protein
MSDKKKDLYVYSSPQQSRSSYAYKSPHGKQFAIFLTEAQLGKNIQHHII